MTVDKETAGRSVRINQNRDEGWAKGLDVSYRVAYRFKLLKVLEASTNRTTL